APVGKAVHGVAGGPAGAIATAALLMMFLSSSVFATAPGLDAYHSGKFEDAYGQFQQTLKTHPESRAEDKLQFDSGAAAYKLKDYSKAMESFSQALLSRDIGLQSKGHYNLGNTLYQRGEAQKGDEKKLSDWTNALDHYEQTLKLDPQNKEAKDNYEYVKKKIDELKNKKEQQQQPSPSPSPPQKDKQKKQEQQQKQQKQQQQQQNQDQKDQQQAQNQQSQKDAGSDKDQKEQQQKDQSQAKNEPQKKQPQKPGESPSPSPGGEKPQENQPSPSPSPGQRQAEQSPSPGEGENEKPSPSPGEGEGEDASPTPADSPQKKFAGDV